MPTAAKQTTINELVQALDESQCAIVTDYRGLTVEQITKLRKRLRPLGAQYQVVKNTLLKIAMSQREVPEIGDMLEGPSAVVFVQGDPVESAKVLAAFIKELRKDLPAIKGGYLGNRVMNAADIANLATLPSREQILANLLGTLQSPASNVVSVLGAVLSNLVGTVEAYSQKAQGSAA